MQTYFQRPAVRRWLMLGAAALIVRAIAFLPLLPPVWVVGIVLGDWAVALVATVGLSVLLGRHLRTQGRLAPWELPGMGIMLGILVFTNPLFGSKSVVPGWLLAMGWVACTFGIVMGILSFMAAQDRYAEQRVTASVEQRGDEEG